MYDHKVPKAEVSLNQTHCIVYRQQVDSRGIQETGNKLSEDFYNDWLAKLSNDSEQ